MELETAVAWGIVACAVSFLLGVIAEKIRAWHAGDPSVDEHESSWRDR